MKVIRNFMDNKPSERGQALVVIVVAMVVLLGFTALAVDGGMVYADRRYAQNSTDASSMAGAAAAALEIENQDIQDSGWPCKSAYTMSIPSQLLGARDKAKAAARDRANSNDFNIANNLTYSGPPYDYFAIPSESKPHGVEVFCGQTDYVTWVDKFMDVTTFITDQTQTAFAHFVFGGELVNTVQAIGRVYPRTALGFGYSVVALREDCPNSDTGGVHYDGNALIRVTGGGIFSNACMDKDGGVDVAVTDGYISCTDQTGNGDCYDASGSSGSVTPAPTAGEKMLPRRAWDIPPPNCYASGMSDKGDHTGGGTISQGRYGRIRVTAATAHLYLNPGLYCVDEMVLNGGEIIEGYGITIYIRDGVYTTNGNAKILFTAPPRNCTTCAPAVPGLLIYSNGNVTLGGTADSVYMGLVYAPDSTIDAGGTGALTSFDTQLIGDTVKLHGTSDLNINFDNNITYYVPAVIELNK